MPLVFPNYSSSLLSAQPPLILLPVQVRFPSFFPLVSFKTTPFSFAFSSVGTFVSITDHNNISGRNPLYGHQVPTYPSPLPFIFFLYLVLLIWNIFVNGSWGARFPDMSSVWAALPQLNGVWIFCFFPV